MAFRQRSYDFRFDKVRMSTNRLPRNALASIAQVIISAVLLFLLYRVLAQKIGVEGIGLWSLVMAGTSIGRIAEFGLSSGAVKFVSSAIARGEPETAASDVCLSAVSVAGILLVGMIASYPIFGLLLDISIKSPNARITAQSLLPFAMVSFWLNGIGMVFQSGLDGCQRMDLRSIIITLSNLVYFLTAYLLADKWGIRGVAWANLGRSIFVVFTAMFVLFRILPLKKVKMTQWSWAQLKKLLNYGVNIQIATIAQLLTEPITKTLLARFGGLSVSGYYEMANRLVTQFRAIIVSAYQALVPRVSVLIENEPDSIVPLYLRSYGLLAFLVPPYFSLLAAAVPEIGLIWLGVVDERFLFVAWIACIGWAVNTMAAPAYYSYLGIGRLRWTTITHLTMGSLNVVLSGSLGMITGWRGVVAGSMLSVIAGTAVVIIAFHCEHRISFSKLIPQQNRSTAIWSVILSVLSLYTTINFIQPPLNIFTATIPMILLALFLCPALAIDSSSKIIIELMRRGLNRTDRRS